MVTKEIQTGVFVHVLPTKQFATTHIAVNFTQQLNRQTLNGRVLASNMLETASAKYSSQTKFAQALSEMTGAAFGTEVFKVGQLHTVRLQLNLVHERFTTAGSHILNDGFDFLNEVINHPIGDEIAGFASVIFNRQKEMALDEVAGLREDKPYYALREALQAYFGASDQALPAFGTIDGLEATTAQQAWQAWQDSVAHDRIDIVVVGDVDFNKVIAATTQFNFAPRQQLLQATYHQDLLPQVKQVKSQDEVTQARLVLGYSLMSNSDERFIANVFNGLFGGLAISRLFLNIRESAGLVYGISSDYNPYTGLLLVEAGVDQINLAITITKINEELQHLQQTLVSEEELAIVKQLLKTSYTMTLDQPLYLADRLYNQQVLHQELTDDAWLAKIDAVTAEQVQAFAQRAVLQLQYEMVGGDINGD